MTISKRMLVAGILAASVLVPSLAQAAVSYSYVASFDGGLTFTTTVNSTQGSNLTGNIYLKETLTNGSASLIASDGGLLGYGFAVDRVNGASTLTGFANNAALFSGPVFTDPNGSATHRGGTGAIALTAATGPNPDANGLILLGTISIAVGSGSSSFVLGVHDNFFGNTLTNTNVYDLDVSDTGYTGAANAPFNFTVNAAAVPEPASVVILAIAGIGVLARRRK